jgi:hypothetical protein
MDRDGFTDERQQQLLKQARLPARTEFPGLGLPAPSQHQAGAFFAGLAQAAPHLARPEVRLWAAQNEHLDRALLQASGTDILQRPTEQLAKLLPPGDDAPALSVASVVDHFAQPVPAAKARHKLQKMISQELHKRNRDALLADMPAPQRALCRAVSYSGCSRWQTTMPDGPDTELTNAQIGAQAKIYLGLVPGFAPEMKEDEDLLCKCKAPNKLRDAPLHPLNCKSGMRTVCLRRHNALVALHVRYHRLAGLIATHHAGAYDDYSKMAPDMTVHAPGGVVLLDITVRNPLGACRPLAGRPLAQCFTTKEHLAAAEQEKIDKYAHMVRRGVKILPVAYTVFGAVAPQARNVASFKHVLGDLPDAAVNKKRLQDQYRRAVSCTIAKFNLEVVQSLVQGGGVLFARDAVRRAMAEGVAQAVDPEEAAERAADRQLGGEDPVVHVPAGPVGVGPLVGEAAVPVAEEEELEQEEGLGGWSAVSAALVDLE